MIFNQITIHFSNVRLSSSLWKQNISLRYGQKSCRYKKNNDTFPQKANFGVFSSNVNVQR